MQRRALGETGALISEVILGCGTFGGLGGARHTIGRGLDIDASFATMDEAVALGINVFDTGERYAGGASELWMGRWLRERGEASRDIHIATKVAPPAMDDVPGRQFDRPYIEETLSRSLERLGLESVTFYLSHAPDPATPIERTLEGFAAAKERGLVEHIGCSN